MGDIRIFSLTARREGRLERHTEPLPLPVVITVEEAAMMLRIGRVTMYDLLRRKVIKSVKIRNCRRVVLASLYEYIESLSDDDDAA